MSFLLLEATHGCHASSNPVDDAAIIWVVGRTGSPTICGNRSGQTRTWRGRADRHDFVLRSQDHWAGIGGVVESGAAGVGSPTKKRGGRPSLTQIYPDLEANFFRVLADHTAGDPMRPGVKWTNLSRRQIARRLKEMGTPAGKDAVSQMLRAHDYRNNKLSAEQFETIVHCLRSYRAHGNGEKRSMPRVGPTCQARHPPHHV
jgi:hypothetical protein